MAFAMPLRSHKAAAILSFCLALGGTSTASAATYYGPPYKVQSFRGVGSFESVGAAVNFLVGKIQAPCQQDPKCTKPPVVTVRYGNDGWAATIYVNGSASDNVFASEILIGQPQKNFGGCQKRCSAGLGSATDGTGARGAADSASKANARDPGSPFEGDPINTSTGNFYRQETDFESPSGLMFRRFYNSSPRAPGSSLGPQWRHLFDRRLEVLASNTGAAGEYTFIRAIRPDGSSERFTRTSSGWTVDADVADVLVDREAGTGYALQLAANRQTEIYDATGLLKEVYDAAGKKLLSLQYSDATTPADVAPVAGLLLTVGDASGRTLRFKYDVSSRLTTMMLPDGASQTFGYNPAGQLASVTYPDATSKGYIYNETANSPTVAGTSFLTGIVDEKGVRYETIKFDYTHRAYHAEFAGGVDTTTLDYAASTWKGTLPVTVKGPLGATSKLGFVDTGKGRLMPAGGSAACGDQCNQPYKAMTYDVNGYPASVTDFKGITTRTTYTADGLLAEQVDAADTPQQRTTTTTWDSALRSPLSRVVKNSAGVVVSSSSWKYNALGLEVARCEVDPANSAAVGYACGTATNAPAGVRQWTTAYCSAVDATHCPQVGLVLAEDGPRSDVQDVTGYSYYLTADESGCGVLGGSCHRAGDLQTETNALDQVTTRLAYDRNGRVSRLRDATGTIHDFGYSTRGKLTSITERSSVDGTASTNDRVTSLSYDATGNVASVVDPDGVSLSYTYDDAHRLVQINDGAGNSIRYTLDVAGNRTKEEVFDAGGGLKRSLSRVYNKLGQLVSQKTAAGNSTDFTYDLTNNVQLITDALKRKTQFEYDALGQLSRTLQDVGGLAVQTRYEYDVEGRTTSVIDPKGLATTYHYSGLGDLISQQSPDTGLTLGTYNSAGQPASRVDANGKTVAYGFDALGRVTRKVYGDQEIVATYSYDIADSVCNANESFASGRLAARQDQSGMTKYCYDQAGNVTRKVQALEGKVLSVQYSYTKAGRLSGLTYPDGSRVDYVRDTTGSVIEVGVTRPGASRQILVSGAKRYPFGPSAGWVYGNGRTLLRELDQDYRPLGLRGSGVGGLSVGYTFNTAGDLIALSGSATGEPSIALAYDSLGRLTAFTDAATGVTIESYAYDATGNRLSAKVNGLEQTYVYPAESHRLQSISGAARSYDSVGNMVSNAGNGRDYSYSAANRMSIVRLNGVPAAEYRYNELGQQSSRVAGGEVSHSLYDEQGRWLGDYGLDTGSVQQLIWLDDLPVGVMKGDALFYVQADHLGAPRVIIDPVRDAVVWTWDLKSEAFGSTLPNEDPDLDGANFEFSLRLPGQRYDAISALSQNMHRDYDPAAGRYVQSDPIGLAAGVSTYAYVNGNPMSGVDPDGLDSIVTYQNLGVTTYYDDGGNVVKSWQSLSAVAGNALPGAAGPYKSANVYPVRGPYKMNDRAYGPNDILKTDDPRGRWIHGGGSRLRNPLAPRQGWTPAVGCTRMQNEDIQELVDMVREAKARNPSKPISYQRMNYERPVIIPFF
ncbi:RHS repeat-associated core domain-containing protein [Stenotrophomonas maltophilia]|uniref:RHS repeat-associated core domain-containing protein n=1 Tax=Stenotrophomonas maltophilia TaxID=40324 RepID=UPI00021E130E|nr:RHS repeat-associated core domain-containing protein [Stenotrophomonas maltophilia]AEM50359.1 RHS repeat-associated core domain-containing protein [Stenotrophomonas maltophilia JV3]